VERLGGVSYQSDLRGGFGHQALLEDSPLCLVGSPDRRSNRGCLIGAYFLPSG